MYPHVKPVYLGVLLVLGIAAACAPRIQSTLDRPLSQAELEELWVEPTDLRSRDLKWGIGGRRLAPDPGWSYTFVEKKEGGFSPGYDVEDPTGREWKVKMGPEARSEVVASRLFWAIGFHQPPIYYLPEWRLAGGPDPGLQGGGRFRPELESLEKEQDWSWHQNPFVGTQAYRGLLVLNVMLNNSDLKPDNNSIYVAGPEWPNPGQWFVVRDIGHTFGRTGMFYGTRDDLDGFLEHRFILGTAKDRVLFEWHGRHGELLEQLSADDVRWTADLLARLTDEQWRDAFEAGGFGPDEAEAFIGRMKEKIRRAQQLAD